MANDNVIDQLSLQIDATANAAIKNLSQMQRQLRNLARDIGSVSAAGKSLSSLSNAFANISRVNTGNLKTAITQLERLEKINLKNLDGKKINLDIQISGADVKERMKYAMADAAKGIDGSKISKALIDAVGFKGELAAKIRKNINDAIASAGKGEGTGLAFSNIANLIDQNAGELRIKKSAYDDYFAQVETEYKEFLNYFKEHPIYLTSKFDRKTFNESTTPWERKGFFNQSRGSETMGRWNEIVNMFPTIMSNFSALEGEEEQVAAVLSTIRDGMRGVSRESIENVKGVEQQDAAWQHIVSSISQARNAIDTQMESGIDKSMRESANKIPLDIDVDINRIESQIADAVAKASKKKYELPIEFDLKPFESSFRNSINSIITGVDVKSMDSFAESIKRTASAMVSVGSIDFKNSGVTKFVNSLKRLAEVDMSKFNGSAFSTLASDIASLANVGDISATISRLVASLARLADAGKNTQYAARALPRLGYALREVVTGLTSAGAIPAELNAFVGAISRLASAGNKALVTAQNLKPLGEAVRGFIESLRNSPDIKESTMRIVESVSAMAQAGASAGSAARGIRNATDKAASSGAQNRLQALKSIIDDLGKAFGKLASLAKQGASKVVSALSSIKRSGNGLNTATNSIKNMIGAMIGFRGIAGLVNLSKQVITLGGDLTEINHIVESVFGDMAGVVEKWSKTAITQFGIAEQSAKRYAGVLSSMFQASGIGYKDAGLMGIKLTELAGDLSAFYNIDTETAFKKIQSGMAGMVRPLRDLGIDLTAATLSEYALSQGISKSYTEMTQAEKVMLRYQYLTSVTTTQQGDFQRTNRRSKRAA